VNGAFVVVTEAVVEVKLLIDLPGILPVQRKGVDEYLPFGVAKDDAGCRWVEATCEEVGQE
jgi:hypothetical protein